MKNRRPVVIAAVALAATTTLVGSSTVSSQAEPTAESAGTWTFDTTGKVVGTGSFTIKVTYNGVPNVRFSCSMRLVGTIASPPPAVSPGGTLSVRVKPPAVISSSDPASPVYRKCTDTYSGEADDVSTSGEAWSIQVRTPTATAPSPWSGVVTGAVVLPQDAITFRTPLVPNCVIWGPTRRSTYTGTYDTSTGVTEGTPGQKVPVAKAGTCTVVSPAVHEKKVFRLSPVVDLVHVP